MRRSYTAARGGVGIWSAVAVLCVLLSFSAYLISTRIGNLLPGERDIISIVHETPSAEVGALGAPWETGTEIDLFDASYENGVGEIVVESAGEDVVIAPGTTSYYRFYVMNNGNAALDFSLRVLPSFYVNGETQEHIPVPISIRLTDQDGNYVIGGYSKWIPVSELEILSETDGSYARVKNTVGVNSYYSYLLEWKWDFEGGNDELDTMLGMGAVESELHFALDVATNVVESDDPKAVGGKRDGDVSGIDWEIRQISHVVFIVLGVLGVASVAMVIYHAGSIDDIRARNGKNRPPRDEDL